MSKYLLIALGVLLVAIPASATPMCFVGCGATNWNMSTPLYWNNVSYDRNGQANVGYYLSGTGASDVPNFWNGSPLDYPPSYGSMGLEWGWTGDLLVTQLQSVTGWNDTFGVYSLVSGQTYPMGSAWDTRGSSWGLPSGDYGFYLTSGEGYTWYSRTLGFDDHSHFALFGSGETWYIGIEDATYTTRRTADWDYNDVILKLEHKPVPESGGLSLLAMGLAAIALWRRR